MTVINVKFYGSAVIFVSILSFKCRQGVITTATLIVDLSFLNLIVINNYNDSSQQEEVLWKPQCQK